MGIGVVVKGFCDQDVGLVVHVKMLKLTEKN